MNYSLLVFLILFTLPVNSVGVNALPIKGETFQSLGAQLDPHSETNLHQERLRKVTEKQLFRPLAVGH